MLAGSIVGFGAIFFILANRFSEFSSVNILYNLTPLIGVGFLYFLGDKEYIPSQVFLGGMLVVASNLAVSLETDISPAYFASLFVMCAVAVFCYFVPGGDIPNYYSAIGIPASIFAILTAFMTERLSTRQFKQEDLAITMFHQGAGSDKYLKKKTENFVATVLAGSRSTDVELESVNFVSVFWAKNRQIACLAAQLATNRLRLFSFGEIFVLWLIGGATLGITILGRPDGNVASLVSVVLASTIVFLCFSVLDPGNLRRSKFLIELLKEQGESSANLINRIHNESKEFLFLSSVSAAFSVLLFGMYAIAVWMK